MAADPIDLEQAITGRRHVRFVYDGQPRIVQPAALGRHTMTGELTLRGYQTGGRSNSRTPPFWTMFAVDKIIDLDVTADSFVDDPPGYPDRDRLIVAVIAQI